MSGQSREPRQLPIAEIRALPNEFSLLARTGEHVQGQGSRHPGVVVAREHERTTLPDEIHHLRDVLATEPHDVPEAPHLVDSRRVDCGECPLNCREVGMDI